MRRIILLAVTIGFIAPILASTPALAQATRTWVSGVGDDVNPCSRTAPCKTFAGAISKTAAAGEINCLDPGGFGAVTITKSMTLNCGATLGSILVAGTNGINISAGAADKIILRGIQIQGVNSGLVGIKIFTAGVVSIEDCVITQFLQQGIFNSSTSPMKLFVKNTVISQNAGSGLAMGAAASSNIELENVYSINNLFGVSAATGNNIMAKRSTFSSNGTGVEADAGAQLNIDNSVISGNGLGIQGNNNLRISNTDIAFNTTANSGITISWGNNRISGNGSAGTALSPAGSASSALGQQ
jgi:hypothetical protein